MSINPINAVNSLQEISKLGSTSDVTSVSGSDGSNFMSIFTDALNNVNESNAGLQTEAAKLASGETDNLHDITIASTKATLSVELFVELRNKALEAYNNIMSTSV